MLSARLSVTCASLLAFCPGCSGGFGGHEPEPDLYPVLSERGHLTYSTNDPHAPRPHRQKRNGGTRNGDGKPRHSKIGTRGPGSYRASS